MDLFKVVGAGAVAVAVAVEGLLLLPIAVARFEVEVVVVVVEMLARLAMSEQSGDFVACLTCSLNSLSPRSSSSVKDLLIKELNA